MQVAFVNINSYKEHREVQCISLDKYKKMINDYQQDNKSPMLECLIDSDVRMYFDIENIDENDDKTVFDIINELVNCFNLNTSYTLTYNPNSRHNRSYHLFFPYKTTKQCIINMIKIFNHKTDYKYFKYVDYRVYTRNRLFRVVNSTSPDCDNKLNKHSILCGNIYDTIIQDYYSLPVFNQDECDNDIANEFSKKIRECKDEVFSKTTLTAMYFKTKLDEQSNLIKRQTRLIVVMFILFFVYLFLNKN